MALGFAITLVSLCVLGGVAYWSDGHLRDHASAARRSEQAIDAARLVSDTSGEAESGVRAYLLTGDASFLPSLTTAVVAADADVAELRMRMTDSASQRKRLDALALAVRRQLAALEEAVDARGAPGAAGGLDAIERARGPRVEVARLAREIEDSEDLAQGARDAEAARVSTVTRRVLGIAMTVAFLLVALALYLLRVDFAGARRARAAFMESHRELETRVRKRTSQLANIVETLRTSEERLRTVTDIARVGLVIVGPDRRYRYANRSYGEVLRLASPDIVGMHVEEVLPAVYGTHLRDRLDRALRGERITYELSMPPGGDDARRYAVSYEPGTEGAERIVVVVVVNVTERKQALDALAQREEQLSLFVAHSPVALSMLDREMKYVGVSRRWLADHGLSDAEVIGRSHYEVFPAIPEAWKEAHRRALAGSVERSDEDSFVRPDGQTIWLRWEIRPWRTPQGAIGGIIIFTEDITARKQADVALRESEERFREIAENIREVFWVTNVAKTEMVYVSPAYETLWGRSCASLYASPADWLEALHPEDRARVARAAADRQGMGAYEETYRILRPDGSVRWIHDRAFPIHDASGAATRVVGLATDITKERSLEEQFRQAQKMEAVGRLAGGVAHDFNNILAVILGYGAMLRTDLGEGDPRAADVDEICKAGRRATELTRQLLLFCRQEVMEPRVLDLNETVAGMRRMVERVIGEDVRLVSERMRATWSVQADPSHVDQIILNLVVNARDAMTRGGTLTFETSNVTLDAGYRSAFLPAKPGQYVMLAITDTGCGMDAATQARIFEPFFTTKERGKGTGLGLSTVFGVVQRCGGTLNVRSEPGEGSTFELYLPRVDAEVGKETGEAASNSAACRGRILVVNDDAAVGKVVTRSLGRLGYDVVRADGPAHALEIVANGSQTFDLLLTDVVMPGLDGPALAKRVTAMQPALKVLYMSGYADDREARGALTENSATFVPKPFTPASLASKVAGVLAG